MLKEGVVGIGGSRFKDGGSVQVCIRVYNFR